MLLARGHGKGANAGHDIAHDLAGLEEVDEPAVLRLELAVPVDLGVVKLERAAVLRHLDVQIVLAGEDLVLKRPELGLGADVLDLVDDGLDLGVLVDEHFGDELLVGQEVRPQVEVCFECQGSVRTQTGYSRMNLPTWPAMLKPAGISSW